MSGTNLINGSLVRPVDSSVARTNWAKPLDAFTQIFNRGRTIPQAKFTDRFTDSIRWISGGGNREKLLNRSMRYAAYRIAGDNPFRAERALYAFSRQLLHCGLVDFADRAMIVGAKLAVGVSGGNILDLSDPMLRERVFSRLVAAGLAVRTDTSMLPSEWELGKRWVLIKHPLDHGQFDEESRKYVGINLLQRKIDPSRPDVESGKKPLIPYRRTDRDIELYRRSWLDRLYKLSNAGIPVAQPAHHVSDNISVRLWKVGARQWNLHFPQYGLNNGQINAANIAFNNIVAQIHKAGFWQRLADWQAARNLVYSLPRYRWVAIET